MARRKVNWPTSSTIQPGEQHTRKGRKNIPEMEKSRKMLNQEGFLREMISKANEQLKKVKKENREKELRGVVFKSLTTEFPNSKI
ncbi:hypothetical protein M0R45_034991 [Rubus argutus]|uniref:Uncharacterized protein n=1 Tax=Rubus argutus TaxID=59490 RepID=A0AAW1VVJ6_RUBAR